MKQKLKTVILAFAGFIVYSALLTVTPLMTDNHYVSVFIADIATILLGGVYMSTVLGQFKPRVEVERRFLITALITVLVFCITSLFTSNLILQNIYDENFVNNHVADDDALLCSTLMSIFLAPVVEEIVFRGFMYRFLSSLNRTASMILTSFVFALYHGTIVHLYAAFFGGLIFCVIYDRTHKLRYSIAAHMLFNALTVFMSVIPYPDFVHKPWWSMMLNVFMLIMLTVFIKTEAVKSVTKPELTEKQKRSREETRRIVDEVMNERKNRT